jgi:uncharacterized protein YigE (DUF2233 family)
VTRQALRAVAVTIVVLALAPASAAAQALQLSSQINLRGTDGRVVPVRTLTFDPRQARLQVLSVPHDVRAPEADLREVADALRTRSDLRSASWALMTGGLSSWRTDVPLGLLVVDGRVVSRLSTEKVTAADSPSRGQWRWAGVLCQRSADRSWRIVPASAYQAGACANALQAGPLLVEEGKAAIHESEPQRTRAYERSAVCLLADGRLRFVLAAQPIHLLPLARWLAAPEPGGGGCRTALNLAGDSSAGLIVQAKGPARSTPPRPTTFGPASFPLPSVLLVHAP